MDKKRRDSLRKVIGECRKLLEVEIARRLRFYGIEAEKFVDVKLLTYLSERDLETRKRLEEAIEKEKLGGIDQSQAIARYIRYVGFTYINRFAALRAMEVRDLIKETIIRKDKFGGRSQREMEIAEREPSLAPDECLKEALLEAFREAGKEIKVLFDVDDEYSLVFPETKTTKEILRLLSEEITEEDWKQDDVIGWIYQYYNDEARREYRASGRKPTPDDIPVINQFYTPHWIVKALVDNTLGKLWMDNHPDSKLKETCTYLIPSNDGSSNHTPKRARDIKVIDPSCGSGHFLIYAFDVLYRIYTEDEPGTPKVEIPSLILENNLHGIDIDLRAVQLAALGLYLKAKTYNPTIKVRKMNLVCADVRISDGERRKEFLRRFADDPALGQIFERLFVDLGYTYELGSLLKVRTLFEQLFKDRKSGQGDRQTQFGLVGQTRLGDEGLTGQTRFLVETKSNEPSLVMVIPKERTIEEMLEELRKFEREAFEANDMGRLLFATETEKSVGLLALLSQSYDVILMNPPYGDMPPRTKEYLLEYYPETHHDYYAAFMEQTVDLARPGGYVGALVGRTFMFLRRFKWVREVLLGKQAPPKLILDLGFGVLDVATARWAAFAARKAVHSEKQLDAQKIVFVRMTEQHDESAKKFSWEDALQAMIIGKPHPLVYAVSLKQLSKVSGTPFSYWASDSIRELFNRHPPIDRDVAQEPTKQKIADAKVGLQTGDDARFSRRFWEVPNGSIGRGRKWVPYANEGGTESFYADIDLVLNWNGDGKGLKDYHKAVIRNEDFYFRSGASWSLIVSSVWLSFRQLPPDTIIGVHGSSIFLDDEARIPAVVSLGNSSLFAFLFLALDPLQHVRHVGYMSKIPINPEALDSQLLRSIGSEAHILKREWLTGSETSTLFIKPWILQVIQPFNPNECLSVIHPFASSFRWGDYPSLRQIRGITGSSSMSLVQLAGLCIKRERTLKDRIDQIQREIDEEVYRIYNISDEDRALIERELAVQQGLEEEKEEQEAVETDEQAQVAELHAEDHIKRLVSYYAKKAIESDDDGIVLLDQSFQDNLLKKVRESIAQDFGKDRLDNIEKEIEEMLGVPLQDWLADEFFDFHLTLYRRRPIFWQLTSRNFGMGRGSAAFSCLVYYHKLTRDTIPKIQSKYIRAVKERIQIEKGVILQQLSEARESGNKKKIEGLRKEYEEVTNRLEELEKFDAALSELHNPRKDKTKLSNNSKWVERAIAEVRDNGWTPIIDYGVRVNIEPLKEARLLPHSADRVK